MYGRELKIKKILYKLIIIKSFLKMAKYYFLLLLTYINLIFKCIYIEINMMMLWIVYKFIIFINKNINMHISKSLKFHHNNKIKLKKKKNE